MEESDRESIRESLIGMFESDGWHYYRESLIVRRREAMAKLLSILPVEANLPVYGEIRAQVRFMDEILSLRAIDIMETIEKHEQ